MPSLVLFNKPYLVLCQFKAEPNRLTLADHLQLPGYHAAGRLDHDSEGLLILTDNGRLQHRICHPDHKLPKRYWAQVEGIPTETELQAFRSGLLLNDGPTAPARISLIDEPPGLWPRTPPIRVRAQIPTQWLDIELHEGRNRQIRRMTAAIGYPTLRLIRHRIGPWQLDGLSPGEHRRQPIPSELLRSASTRIRPSTAGRTASRIRAPKGYKT